MNRHRLAPVLAALALLAVFVAFLAWRLAFLSTQPRLFKDLYLEVTPEDSIALSPDGSLLAYTAPHGDDVRLHLRRLDDGVVTRPEGTEGAERPFFSPDSRRLGYYVGERLRTHAIETDAADEEQMQFRAPRAGEWVLTERDGAVVATSLSTNEERQLLDDARRPHYLEPGYLLFLREGDLWAARLGEDGELASEPFLVVSGVDGWYDVSANGTLAVRRPGEGRRRRFSVILNWSAELERLASGTDQGP